MADEKAPAYQWYLKDWRSSRTVHRMSFSERGVYREMLDEQWESLTLPDDPQAVADIIASTPAQEAEVLAAWPAVRRKFVTVAGQAGRIRNLPMERFRKERRAFLRARSEAGRIGGATRAVTAVRRRDGTFMPTHNDALQEPDSIQTQSTQEPHSDHTLSSAASASSSASATAEEQRHARACTSEEMLNKTENSVSQLAVNLNKHWSIPINGTTDDVIAERAGRFCNRYAELYPLHRHGARYLPKPALDWPKACELCAIWDDARLDLLATVFLKCEEPFAAGGSRTIGQFAAMASWADGRLAEEEARA